MARRQGVTLAHTTLARDLINGRLARPFALALPLAASRLLISITAGARVMLQAAPG
jgi:hypothetical protein